MATHSTESIAQILLKIERADNNVFKHTLCNASYPDAAQRKHGNISAKLFPEVKRNGKRRKKALPISQFSILLQQQEMIKLTAKIQKYI